MPTPLPQDVEIISSEPRDGRAYLLVRVRGKLIAGRYGKDEDEARKRVMDAIAGKHDD